MENKRGSMRTITYVSSAKRLFSPEALVRLLRESRKRNLAFGITGLLLYKSGCFMQTIEGPEDAIRRLYGNICADPSHHRVTALLDEPITGRSFPEWHMGFGNLDNPEILTLAGFSRFFQDPLDVKAFQADASSARQLLFTFRQSVR